MLKFGTLFRKKGQKTCRFVLKPFGGSFNRANSRYRAFSLTWPASMPIYWNKRNRLHKKRVQLPEDWFGTPTWPSFHCFGTPIWPPWRHVKTLCSHCFCILGVKTNFILRIKSIVQAKYPVGRLTGNYIQCCGQTHPKLYTLFWTERLKTTPCPAAHPRGNPYKSSGGARRIF